MYPEELVYPMRKQLTDQGFDELKSIDDVENMVSNKGTTLVVVNSVCGCAVHMLERHNIEGRSAEMISQNLKGAYNEHC